MSLPNMHMEKISMQHFDMKAYILKKLRLVHDVILFLNI